MHGWWWKDARRRPASVAAIWTPTQAEGDLDLWCDATDTSTLVQDGSGFVSRWTSKDPSARFYEQLTGSQQPQLQASSIGGLSALYFDSGDFLRQSVGTILLPVNTPWAFAAVVKMQAFTNPYTGIMSDGDGVVSTCRISFTQDLDYRTFYVGTSDLRFPRVRWDWAFSVGSAYVLEMHNNGVPNLTAKENNNGLTTLAAGDMGLYNDVGTVGTWISPGGEWHGHIGEIIIIRNPTANDLTNLATYMQRWGTY